jgi:hypothetical protein
MSSQRRSGAITRRIARFV